MLRARLLGFRIQHFVAIAMIGGDDDRPTVLLCCVYNATDFTIDGFYRFDNWFRHRRVPDHIGVGKIYNDERILLLCQPPDYRICHLASTHFRFEVVSGDLW